jgi:hypothetical protein
VEKILIKYLATNFGKAKIAIEFYKTNFMIMLKKKALNLKDKKQLFRHYHINNKIQNLQAISKQILDVLL